MRFKTATILLVLVITACAGQPETQKSTDNLENQDTVEPLKTPEPTAQTSAETLAETSPPASTPGEITYEQFLALSLGDTLDSVRDVLGMEGEVVGRSAAYDTGGYIADIHSFSNEEGTAQVDVSILEDGTVVAMNQVGLGLPQGNITLQQFNQVKPGQTLANVETIFGTAAVLATAEQLQGESETAGYLFSNSDGSFALISVQDGIVTENSMQLNLP